MSCLSQCLATGSEDLVHWRKQPGNPILADPPEEFRGRLNAWHEPHVWREDDFCSAAPTRTDRATDVPVPLVRSDHVGVPAPVLRGHGPRERWLVPDFFPSGDRHVLLFSDGCTFALIGDYRDHRFVASRRQRVDHGRQFDSAPTLRDAAGRRLLFGWIREDRPVEAYLQAGWAGMTSLPRALSVEDEELPIEVPPEGCAGTAPDAEVSGADLAPGTGYSIDGADADCLEVAADIEVRDAASVGLTLCHSPGGQERTTVVWHRTSRCCGWTARAPAWTRRWAPACTTPRSR